MRAQADEHGFAILAPASRERSWDIIVGEYGPDVSALDETLSSTFNKVNVRPESLAISGFSDGASYALSIGIANGDLFHDIIAFSPGFMTPAIEHDKPRIFISHGIADSVLPIDRCSRVIVRRLHREGYDVTYSEFDGPHTVPHQIKEQAIEWWQRPVHLADPHR